LSRGGPVTLTSLLMTAPSNCGELSNRKSKRMRSGSRLKGHLACDRFPTMYRFTNGYRIY